MVPTNPRYLAGLEKADKGEIFLIAPSKPVTVTRFDGDMDKLGDLYWLGYHDLEARIEELKQYIIARE